MNTNDAWAHIPKKPRLGLDRPNYRWRHFSYVLLGLAVICGLFALLHR